jgi:DNA polymerase III epsilon subunit family exonuclease
MQLAFDAVDRLVELLEERGRPLEPAEAAVQLLALRSVPDGLARSLVGDLVEGDGRLVWRGSAIALASAPRDPPLDEVELVVFDLETTGLSARSARICEIGAVRVRRLELCETFQTLVRTGVPLPAAIHAITGIGDEELRNAPSVGTAMRAFLDFAGDATLVAHNARFDVSFLDRQLERLTGRRLAAPALDTAALARRLLEGRVRRVGLASLAHFYGTAAEPCHRALPDALATAEVLVRLIGEAQERGARTLSQLHALAAPRVRRVYGKRSLAHGAPARPGVYLFRDRHAQVLYVGRARDLRARLRSYFRSDRQRPAVEAALGAVERIEWRVLGSELEAGFEELKLIREFRPPANARNVRPDRYLYLRRRGDRVVAGSTPGPLGPIRGRRRAERAARALDGASEQEFALLLAGGPLPRLRARLADLAACLRYEDAARLRDRISALESVIGQLQGLERMRAEARCLVAPAVEPGWRRAFFVAGGRVCGGRMLPPGGGVRLEVEAGVAEARAALAGLPSYAPEDADDLLVVREFVRRPPPEVQVLPLDAAAICAQLAAAA